MSSLRALLDANVFVTTWTLDVLLTFADKGLFEPYWSEYILMEAERAICRVHSDDTDRPKKQLAMINDAFPFAMVQPNESNFKEIKLPDQDDSHVVTACITAECQVIVTYNLKDFPDEVLAPWGIRAIHPDAFLFNIAEKTPEVALTALRAIVGWR